MEGASCRELKLGQDNNRERRRNTNAQGKIAKAGWTGQSDSKFDCQHSCQHQAKS